MFALIILLIGRLKVLFISKVKFELRIAEAVREYMLFET